MTDNTAPENDIIIDLNEPSEELAPESTPTPEPVVEQPAPQLQPKTDYKTEYENMQAALREERARNREQFESLKKDLEEYRKSKETTEKQTEFEQDPITAMKSELEDLKRFKNETEAEREMREKEEQTKENVRRYVVQSREEFEKTNPDYHQAYAHVMDIKSKELMALGFRDQYALNQSLEFEMQRLINHAIATNQNPAGLIYQMAKATGYSNVPAQKEKPEEALERIAAGQAAATNSGHGSKSGAAPKSLRLSDIDRMSTKEFEQMWEDLRKKGKLG